MVLLVKILLISERQSLYKLGAVQQRLPADSDPLPDRSLSKIVKLLQSWKPLEMH